MKRNRPSNMKLQTLLFVLTIATLGLTVGCGKNKDKSAGNETTSTKPQVSAVTSPAGHWETEITADGQQRIQISLDLTKNEKSEWIGSMGAPAMNKTGLVVKDVVVNGTSVKFVAVELMMATFDLTLGEEGTMKGMISGRAPQPVEFKRTGEANVELIPASPAVSKELEGDWEGLLKTPNGSPKMVFHFKNQADKTVQATIDAGQAVGLPLDNVKQTGQNVAFGIKIAGGTFQGVLNQAGTELIGQLTGGPTPMPLTLKKIKQ